MAQQITQAEAAERYHKSVLKKKAKQVLDHVTALRITETAVNGGVSVATGAIKAAKPAWEEAAYGLVIDGTTFGVGLGVFIIAGDKRSGDYVREIGGGMMQSGIANLGTKAGKALYTYLTK